MYLLKLSLLVLFLLAVNSVLATETPSPIEVELGSELQGIEERCKSTTGPDSCILEKLEKKRRLYELFLDNTAPPAWSDVDVISFGFFHVAQQIAKGQIRCSSLGPSARQSCFEQISSIISGAREEVRQLLMGKGGISGRLEAAEKSAKERQPQDEYSAEQVRREMELARERRLSQAEIQAQREHELELARIQALGLMMQGRGLFQQPPAPIYTPPPPIPAPEIPRARNCTSNIIGNQVYTNCY
jgi:hypothetical protein